MDCLIELHEILGGDKSCYEQSSRTNSEQGRSFAIKATNIKFIKIKADCYFAQSIQKCDSIFFQCPLIERKVIFVELAGGSKSSKECYVQLETSILEIKKKIKLDPSKTIAFIVGSKIKETRIRPKSDENRELKDKFVKRNLGQLFIENQSSKFILIYERVWK